MHKILAALCLVSISMFAQEAQQTQIQRNMQQTEPQKPVAAKKKTSVEQAQQEERGRRMLELAEAQAAGLQGGMRAYAFWQLARTYQRSDKAKALELLEGAMTATRDMEDGNQRNRTRTTLQQQVLQDMVPLAPQHAEELLGLVEADSREPVLNALLGYYEKNNDLDHGMELVYRIGQEKEIPYQAAGRIMAALPPERSGDLLQLFTVAFASYRDHQHTELAMGGTDFASLVVQFWQKLPANLTHDAIDEVLKQASAVKDAHLSMSNEKGAAAFNSYYDYRLFQLLPVLRNIDESEANELLKKNQEMKAMLAKYPEGLGTFAPNMAGPPPPAGAQPEKRGGTGLGMGTSMAVSSGGARLSGADSMMLQQQQANKILNDAEEHPDAAIGQAALLPNVDMRANVYQMIARAVAKKSPSTARTALDKALSIVDQVQPMQQVGIVRSAAELYLQMGEIEDAKKTVERGFKIADRLLATDTNADDPNQALKAYWPSAEAWRSFTRLAGQISPTWAMAQIDDIQDPEMKVMAQTALAQQWLDVTRGGTTVMSQTKKGNMMMRENEQRQ